MYASSFRLRTITYFYYTSICVFFFISQVSTLREREKSHPTNSGHQTRAQDSRWFLQITWGENRNNSCTAADGSRKKKLDFTACVKKKINKMLTYKREMYPQMRYCHLSYRQNVYVLRLDPIRQSRFTDFHRSKIIFFLLNIFLVSTITRNTRMQSFQAHFRLHFHFASAGILKTRKKKMISLTWKMDRWKKKIHEVKI